MKTEQLQEKWYSFIRFHCKSGWIDRWNGDCIDSPNNSTGQKIQLNSFSTYWRLNDELWVSGRSLGSEKMMSLLEIREGVTANEIWKQLVK